MARDYSRPVPGSTGPDSVAGLIGKYDVNGAYANRPAATPKYRSSEGRDGFATNLTVARIYITGDKNFDSLPGPARNFKFGSYVGFLLSEVTERNSEKTQISPLNGDGYAAYFSGREPTTYSFSGIFLNTRQDQWRSTFTHLYENLFRGSKIAGLSRMVQVCYDDKVVTGSMLNLNQVISAAPDETYTRFTFDILVAAVYDSWMKDEAHFDEAWKAFIGDTTIFPDYPAISKREDIKNYTRTAYTSLPPKVRPKGAKKTKFLCGDLSNIVVDKNGIFLKQPNGAMETTSLPKGCDLLKEKNALSNEIASLKAKLAKATNPEEKAATQASIDSLTRKFNVVTTLFQQTTGQKIVYDTKNNTSPGPTSDTRQESSETEADQSLADQEDRENSELPAPLLPPITPLVTP
jgi:hypothetical protein